MSKSNCKKQKEQKPKAATKKPKTTPATPPSTPASATTERPWLFQPGQSGNPNGRPVGAVSQVLRMAREAAMNVGLPKLIESAERGDIFAARTLVQLGLPKPKPASEPEPFALEGGTLTEKAASMIELVSNGVVTAATGGEVVAMLATVAKIEEVERLQKEVEKLQAALEELENESR